MEKYLTPMGPTKLHVMPIFEIGPLEPRYSEWLVFEGISVDESGAAMLTSLLCMWSILRGCRHAQ